MSSFIATTSARPTTTHRPEGDPHPDIDHLRRELAQLTTCHETLRAGIRRELTTLVARRWVRPRDADEILTGFDPPKPPHCYTADAVVPVTLALRAGRGLRRAWRGLRSIADDLRNLRDIRRQARTRNGADNPYEGRLIHRCQVAGPVRPPPTAGRSSASAGCSPGGAIDGSRATSVWRQARQRLVADLAPLRVV